MDNATTSQNTANRNKSSPGVVIYNAVVVILDLAFLLVKFWVVTFREIFIALKSEEKDVSKEIVLITGTGHGIGKELALQYSALGSTVVCWDINEKLNLETVKLLKENGGKAFGYTVDVTNREKVLETANKVLSDVGDVGILINNAGIMPQHGMLKHSENEVRKIYDINIIAHCWMFQAFLPKMIEHNKGHIVALSSIAGVAGLENIVPYCGSKFGVRGQMEAMMEELRKQSVGKSQIKFTTVCPYMVDTGLCKNVKIRFEEFLKLLKPSEVAAAIVSAQRRDILELTVPRYLYYLNQFLRFFPMNAANLVKDFFASGVEEDM